jgi:hydrogenase small subunit
MSRAVGRIIRPLRMYTNEHLNRETRWDLHHETPTGWARQKPEPGPVRETGHKLYDVIRRSNDRGKKRTAEWGKRMPEWTEQAQPRVERELPGGAESPVPPGQASMPAQEPEHDEGPES